MIGFKAKLMRFDKQGEKTSWTYILIPGKIADKIKPGTRRSFRIKGSIHDHELRSVALIPMGGGDFILPVNASMRKAIQKNKGDVVEIEMEEDKSPVRLSASLLECLDDEPESKAYFSKLPASHQQYYSKWIESAKTDVTKTKRIAAAIHAFSNKLTYAQMIQLQRKELF